MRTLGWILTVTLAVSTLLVMVGWVFCSVAGVRTTFAREAAALLAAEKPELSPAPPSNEQLARLPPPVRRFLEVSGFDRVEKIGFLHARYRARMNLKGLWFPMVCEQYNSVDQGTRLWYGRIDLLPFLWVEGRHLYAQGRAHMLIKFGPIALVDIKSPQLANADMITFFNDMAFFMPNALVHPSIEWRIEDSRSVTAVFENAGFSNSARLSFDTDGMLINFDTETRGRLEGDTLVKARWATPITGWQLRNGLKVATEGLALYYGPTGTEPYIRFEDQGMVLDYNQAARE